MLKLILYALCRLGSCHTGDEAGRCSEGVVFGVGMYAAVGAVLI